MVHHVALMRFKEGTTPEQIQAITDALAELPGKIDVLKRYSVGADIGLTDRAWDYAATADFAGVDDYLEYSTHPDHVAVIKNLLLPVLADTARIQFETTDA